MESSCTRYVTHAPCIDRWMLYHWTTREVSVLEWVLVITIWLPKGEIEKIKRRGKVPTF